MLKEFRGTIAERGANGRQLQRRLDGMGALGQHLHLPYQLWGLRKTVYFLWVSASPVIK
jgi:hypothetical protein